MLLVLKIITPLCYRGTQTMAMGTRAFKRPVRNIIQFAIQNTIPLILGSGIETLLRIYHNTLNDSF